jgi:aminobenzoyl-glutamate utilization protein A
MEYMEDHAERVLRGAAAIHDCEVTVEKRARAPSAASDDDLADLVAEVAADVDGVTTLVERDDLGGSEDATFLMRAVQERGGKACYVCIGTDHPGGHHTATFDVDEASLPIGVDVVVGALERTSRDLP